MGRGTQPAKPAYETLALAMVNAIVATSLIMFLGGDVWSLFRLVSQSVTSAPVTSLALMRDQWAIHNGSMRRAMLANGREAPHRTLSSRFSPLAILAGCLEALIPGSPNELPHWLVLCGFHKSSVDVLKFGKACSPFREAMQTSPVGHEFGYLGWAISLCARAAISVGDWSSPEPDLDSLRHRLVCLFPSGAMQALSAASVQLRILSRRSQAGLDGYCPDFAADSGVFTAEFCTQAVAAIITAAQAVAAGTVMNISPLEARARAQSLRSGSHSSAGVESALGEIQSAPLVDPDECRQLISLLSAWTHGGAGRESGCNTVEPDLDDESCPYKPGRGHTGWQQAQPLAVKPRFGCTRRDPGG